MIYEVYIDKLFFINFIMNFYLLSLVNMSAYYSASLKRILLGALAGALAFLIPLCLPSSYLLRIGIGMILNLVGMLKLAFPAVTVRRFLYYCEKLAIYSFAMGGAMIFTLRKLPADFHNVILVALLGGVIYLALLRYRLGRRRAESKCSVLLRSAGGEVQVQGFLDTGNGLFEPISGKPVCVVDRMLYESLCDEESKGFRIVPYTSIGKKSGIMHASPVEVMEIHFSDANIVLQDVYIACGEEFSEEVSDRDMEQIRIILHPKLIEEKDYGGKLRKVGKYDFQDNVARKNPAQPDS